MPARNPWCVAAILGPNPPGKHYLCRQTGSPELPQRIPWPVLSIPAPIVRVTFPPAIPWGRTLAWAAGTAAPGRGCCCREVKALALQPATVMLGHSLLALSVCFPVPQPLETESDIVLQSTSLPLDTRAPCDVPCSRGGQGRGAKAGTTAP